MTIRNRNWDVFDVDNTDPEPADPLDATRQAPAVVLWSAIDADRRALDERTARLRAMRLTLGDDEWD